MELKPGSRWMSATCNTEVAVVRPAKDAVLQCGGLAMIAIGAERPVGAAPARGLDGGTLIGKRYADPASGLEVLCTKPGAGSLAVDGRAMDLKEAKRLPSSD